MHKKLQHTCTLASLKVNIAVTQYAGLSICMCTTHTDAIMSINRWTL